LVKATSFSSWNCENKLSLLLAEKFSISSENEMAEQKYNIAIECARSSKFIHEEALAWYVLGCEMQLDYS